METEPHVLSLKLQRHRSLFLLALSRVEADGSGLGGYQGEKSNIWLMTKLKSEPFLPYRPISSPPDFSGMPNIATLRSWPVGFDSWQLLSSVNSYHGCLTFLHVHHQSLWQQRFIQPCQPDLPPCAEDLRFRVYTTHFAASCEMLCLR